MILDEVGKGNPQFAIYYPQHGIFEVLNVLVVAWNAADKRVAVLGYQLSERPSLSKVTETTSLCTRMLFIRGNAARKTTLQKNWTCSSEKEISTFLVKGDKTGPPQMGSA